MLNPAVTNRTTDRAHRIRHYKPVFVCKLICAETIEEKILAMKQRKAGLAKAALKGGRSTTVKFSAADVEALFGDLG